MMNEEHLRSLVAGHGESKSKQFEFYTDSPVSILPAIRIRALTP
jgi:hypothetical protein